MSHLLPQSPEHLQTEFVRAGQALAAESGLAPEFYGPELVRAFEQAMCRAEHGCEALATPSGHSAIALLCLALCRRGDEVVCASQVYGGTFTLLNFTLRRLGVRTRFVDITNTAEVEEALSGGAKLLLCESIGNPSLVMPDLAELAACARAHGAVFAIDGTTTSPVLLQALRHGADVVVHSTTKYIGGQGSTLGGIIIDGGSYDWAKLGMSGGLVQHLREEWLDQWCGEMPAVSAHFFLHGLETLVERMRQHCDTTLALAAWLEADPRIAWVTYPGLASHPSHLIAKKYVGEHGYGGLFAFGPHGGLEAGRTFVESCRLASFVTNIGDARTLVLQPATTTHSWLSPFERLMAGVSDEMIRVSVGLEHVEDLMADFDQALRLATGR